MAKKKLKTKEAAMHTATVPAATAARRADVPVIVVPPGGTLRVIVDVGPMVFPYTVAYAGHTVMKSLVNRAEFLSLQTGHFPLAWSFAHAVKGWFHSIGYSISNGPVKILEHLSEENHDDDTSVNFAVVTYKSAA
jgi:hypothetical protein